MTLNLVIVDDEPAVHAVVRMAVDPARVSLSAHDDPQAFLDQLADVPPSVVLLDLCMPGHDGLAVQRILAAHSTPFCVVFLSGAGGIPDAVEAMRNGAVDFLRKPFRREALHAALARAERALDILVAERERRRRLDVLDQLTPREMEVLQTLAQGHQTKMVAHQLNISARTVEMHRANIIDKLGVPITGALLMAHEAGRLTAA